MKIGKDTIGNIVSIIVFGIVGFLIIPPIYANIPQTNFFFSFLANIGPVLIMAWTVNVIGWFGLNIADKLFFEGTL